MRLKNKGMEYSTAIIVSIIIMIVILVAYFVFYSKLDLCSMSSILC